MSWVDERAAGRVFARVWVDEQEGLLLHPITAGYQLTIMKFYSDAGRYSGRRGWSDEQHHAFISGCRRGLADRGESG